MTDQEIIVDSFAGGGGASLGISRALGRCPDIAINHDADAIAMHAANHPDALHCTEDVWKVSPHKITSGKPVGLLWASPDCKHFSRAKGSKPVSKNIRSLAWIVVKWAAECSPRVIVLENVREFEDWGPLLPQQQCLACDWKGTEGQTLLARQRRRCPKCNSVRLRVKEELVPDPDKKGLTFRRFVGRLKKLGYKVDWRSLNAADFGAPTHRRRLFLIARNDGLPIEWPAATHADPKKIDAGGDLFGPALQPWRMAAECIDWSISCPSIFDRKRPLAEKTLKRIAAGIKRYVLENPKPFIVPVTHVGERRNHSIDEPMPTVTGANRGEMALVTPFMIPRYGESGHQPPRSSSVEKPMPAVIPTANGATLISPILVGAGGPDYAAKPREADRPIGSLTAEPRTAVVSAFIAKHFGGQVGTPIDTPLPTTTVRGTQNQVAVANLVHMNHGEKTWNGADEPLRTITSGTHAALIASNLVRFNHDDAGIPVDAPAPTITQCNHAALVYSFLIRYFGTAIGQHVTEPIYTITGKDRFGLVTVTIDGEPYVIVDIGMRMLVPRELARCQGFPDSYVLTGTKTSQVARIGNSVCPDVAAAIIEANFCGANVED